MTEAGPGSDASTWRITFAPLLMLLSSCGGFSYDEFRSRYTAPGSQINLSRDNDFSVRFLGNTNLLISDGVESILIDAFFSYPVNNGAQVLLSQVMPDAKRVDEATNAPEFSSLNAIVVTHSHHDHAMDVGEVAAKFPEAYVVGSESTRNIVDGWVTWDNSKPRSPAHRAMTNAITKDRFRLVPNLDGGDPFKPDIKSRSFSVRILPGSHAKSWLSFLEAEPIDEPLVPPLRILDYPAGDVYIIHIEHVPSAQSILVVGSAGVPDGKVKELLSHLGADVVFLAVAGMPRDPTLYLNRTIGASKPSVVIPFHWDSQLEAPKNGRVVEPRGLYAAFARVDTGLETVRDYVERNSPESTFLMLPYDERVTISTLKELSTALSEPTAEAIHDRIEKDN